MFELIIFMLFIILGLIWMIVLLLNIYLLEKIFINKRKILSKIAWLFLFIEIIFPFLITPTYRKAFFIFIFCFILFSFVLFIIKNK